MKKSLPLHNVNHGPSCGGTGPPQIFLGDEITA